MNLSPRTRFRFDVDARELKLIRKALHQFGGNAGKLEARITEQLNQAKVELIASIEASMTVEETEAPVKAEKAE